MPLLPASKGKDAAAVPKKKVHPPEPCGCGADTYRAPPKGKKTPAIIVHNRGCVYQRTTCDAYPHLPLCTTCQEPCRFCLGKNRWCPHCYEKQCTFRYKRVVIGVEPLTGADVGRGKGGVDSSIIRRSASRRRTTMRMMDGKSKASNAQSRTSSKPRGTSVAVS
ncbi:unspecified product [Leishmania tarentolae]|uniref:Unspecified product n=1 Tax=Leishmania tarentolae TaxID=5689 RepID=A0A640KUY5_LEITA|nr:unspecified product [Leishmania tarentolae]